MIANFYKARRQNRRLIRETADNGNYTLNPQSLNNRSSSSLLTESPKTLELRKDIEDKHQDFVFLCELDTRVYGECNENATGQQLCVDLALNNVGICEKKENVSSVPICKDVSYMFQNRSLYYR